MVPLPSLNEYAATSPKWAEAAPTGFTTTVEVADFVASATWLLSTDRLDEVTDGAV